MTTLPPVIVVGGPTAGGKSALAMALALHLNGEIIGADSRQLYAGLEIAAAGPTSDEKARVRHHLYGSIAPEQILSAGHFVTLTDNVMADITRRKRVAIVVGGTGLYLRALRVGLHEASPYDPVLRARLQEELRTQGLSVLVERLRESDAAAAGVVDLRNPVRVIRALELSLSQTCSATRDTAAQLAAPPRASVAGALWILFSRGPEALSRRIDARAQQMFSTTAIIDEARALAARLSPEHPLLDTIGVAEALAVARGTLAPHEAAARTATRTRQYARRQRTWFRKEPWWETLTVDDDARSALGTEGPAQSALHTKDDDVAEVAARIIERVAGSS